MDILHVVVVLVLLSGPVFSIFCGVQWRSKFPRYYKFHTGLVITTIFSQCLFLGCPLAYLSTLLRHQYDPEFSFGGSFTAYMFQKFFGINVPVAAVTVSIILLAIFTVIMIVSAKVSVQEIATTQEEDV